MAEIGKYYVQIVPSAEGISGGIEKAIAPQAQSAGTMAGRQLASKMGGTISSLGGTMMKAGAIATAVSVPIIAGIKSALSAYEVQTAAETKLTEIYKTRMGATSAAAKATMEYASALQKEGIIGDEVMLSGAQQVATFAKMPETVNKLLPAMNNLLAQQKGYNATAEDATGIANLMGKALQGQTGALTRVGITFDETQAKILKTGTEEERAAVLAEVITQNVGNMNETMAQTPLGKIQQMKNAYGDLKEQIGAQLAPVLMQVAGYIQENILPAVTQVINFMQANPVVAKIIVGLTGVLAIGGPLVAMAGALTGALGGLLTAAAGLSAPVLGIAAAIAVGAAAFAVAYAKSETFRSALNGLVQSIAGELSPVVESLKSFLTLLIKEFVECSTAVGNALAPAIKLLTPMLTFLASLIAMRLTVVFRVLGAGVQTAAAIIKAGAAMIQGCAQGISNILSTVIPVAKRFAVSLKSYLSFKGMVSIVNGVFNAVKNAIIKPFQPAYDKIKGIVDKIKGLFPLSIGKIFSGLKLPHFTVSGGSAPWGIAGKGSMPKFNVSWYAKAVGEPYVFEKPTLFGAGEAGDEVLYGRSRLLSDIKSAVGDNPQQVVNNYEVNIYGVKDMVDSAEQFVGIVRSEMGIA